MLRLCEEQVLALLLLVQLQTGLSALHGIVSRHYLI